MVKMDKSLYFVLIFCGIFSQGICNVFQENNEKSLDLLIRQKRVVGGSEIPLNVAPYVLYVLENGNYHCPATLLTADVVISSATCFINENAENMRIVSRSRAGTHHHYIVKVILLDPHFQSDRRTVNNLALVRFAQPINFQTSLNRPITIYNGFLPADQSPAQIISWTRLNVEGNRRIPSESLRALSVLVISFDYCRSIHPNVLHPFNICAVGTVPGDNCDSRDTGAPLVINNQLLGIFVYRGNTRPTFPNVFMNLLDHDIRRWIHQHVPSLRLF